MTVAIIGTGWGVRVQVPAFRSAGLEIVALAGRDAAKTEKIANGLGIPVVSGDWRSVIARDDVKIVSIVTPPNLHAEIAIAALEAGKHVLCEKPTAMNAAEAEAMLEASTKHPNQLALIDHEMRFAPALIKLRNSIRDGLIGTVRQATLRIAGTSRTNPNALWNWWSDSTQGGGLLGAVGSHNIDTLRFLLNAEITSVSALLHTFVTQRPSSPDALNDLKNVTTDDYYQLRLSLDNGTLATAEANMTAPIDDPNTFTFYGTTGALRWQTGKLYHAPSGGSYTDITPVVPYPLPEGVVGDFPQATVAIGHALKAYLAGDHNALKDAATFADGLRIQKVLDAARQSHAQRGVEITLD